MGIDGYKARVLIIASNAKKFAAAVDFLQKRGWSARAVSKLKTAIAFLIQFKPTHVLISIDHPHPKILQIPKLFERTFKCTVIVCSESQGAMVHNKLQRTKVGAIMYGPLSGPGIFLKIQQLMERDLAKNMFLTDDLDNLDKAAEELENKQDLQIPDLPEFPEESSQPSAKEDLDAKGMVKIKDQGNQEEADNVVFETDSSLAADNFGDLDVDDDDLEGILKQLNLGDDEDKTSSGKTTEASIDEADDKDALLKLLAEDADDSGFEINQEKAKPREGMDLGTVVQEGKEELDLGDMVQEGQKGRDLGTMVQEGQEGLDLGSIAQEGPESSDLGSLVQEGQNNDNEFSLEEEGSKSGKNTPQVEQEEASQARTKMLEGEPVDGDLNIFNEEQVELDATYEEPIDELNNDILGPVGEDTEQDGGFFDLDEDEEATKEKQRRAEMVAMGLGFLADKDLNSESGGVDSQGSATKKRRMQAQDRRVPRVTASELKELQKEFKELNDERIESAENKPKLSIQQAHAEVTMYSIEAANCHGYVFAALSAKNSSSENWQETLKDRIINYLIDSRLVDIADIKKMKLQETDIPDWGNEYASFVLQLRGTPDEITLTFIDKSEIMPKRRISGDKEMEEISLDDIPPDETIDFDLFVFLPKNEKYVRYVRKGGFLAKEQMENLQRYIENLHVRNVDLRKFRTFYVHYVVGERLKHYLFKKVA